MKPTFVKSGINYIPAIKSSYSGNVKVLYGDVLPTVAAAKKYAQIEINRLNKINFARIIVNAMPISRRGDLAMTHAERKALTAIRNNDLWNYLQDHSQAAAGLHFSLTQGRVCNIAKQYALKHGLTYKDKRRK